MSLPRRPAPLSSSACVSPLTTVRCCASCNGSATHFVIIIIVLFPFSHLNPSKMAVGCRALVLMSIMQLVCVCGFQSMAGLSLRSSSGVLCARSKPRISVVRMQEVSCEIALAGMM